MPPQSRGSGLPTGFQSKSTPNLPTLSSLSSDELPQLPKPKTDINTFSASTSNDSPSEPASVEDNLSTTDEPFNLDVSSDSTSVSDDEFEFEFEHRTTAAAVAPSSSSFHARSTSNEPSKPRRPLYSHASRSHSHLPHTSSALFPPFYNRPPTPLPPSPSLTSLLRPSSFSTQTSRPTTPDSSDVEAPTTAAAAAARHKQRSNTAISTSASGTGTPTNNLASSFASATPIPRASPKVPTYEYYGFFIYLASSFAFLMYILWAYLPRPFLHQLGIYYYPNRWWALAVPAWLVGLVIYIYVALASYNVGYLTLPLRSIENLVDEAAQIAVLDREGRIVRQAGSRRIRGKDGKGKERKRRSGNSDGGGGPGMGRNKFLGGEGTDWAALWSESTDAVMDVPIGGVCEILYGIGREEEDGEVDDVLDN